MRDRIASYARNLSPFSSGGKPTAGLRLDVPTHLKGVYKALMQYGYALKVKHGDGLKRNVRFDDMEQTMCMDVKFPKESKWVTLDFDMAMEDKRARAKREVRGLDRDRLSSFQKDDVGQLDGAPVDVDDDEEHMEDSSVPKHNGSKTWTSYR